MAELGTLEWDVSVPGARSAEQQVRALDDQFAGAADAAREAEAAVDDLEGASESTGREVGELDRRVTGLIGSMGALGSAVPDLGLGGGDGGSPLGGGGPGGGGPGGGGPLDFLGDVGAGAGGGFLARLGLGGLGGTAGLVGGVGILTALGLAEHTSISRAGSTPVPAGVGPPPVTEESDESSALELLLGADIGQQRGDILGPAAHLGVRGQQFQQNPLGTLVDVFGGGGGGDGSPGVAITGQGQERARMNRARQTRNRLFDPTSTSPQNVEIGSIEVQADGLNPESLTEADLRRLAEKINEILGRQQALMP